MKTKNEALEKMTKQKIKEAYALDYFFNECTNDYEDYLTEQEMDEIALRLQGYDVELLDEEEIDRLFYYCSLDKEDPEFKGYKIEINDYDNDVRRIVHSTHNFDKKIVLIKYEGKGINPHKRREALGYLYLHKKEQYPLIFKNLNLEKEFNIFFDLCDEEDLNAIGDEIIYRSSNEFNFTDDYIVVVIN